MQSQKQRYKVNFVSPTLGLDVDVKKIIQIITNRLLDNIELLKLDYFIKRRMQMQVCWVNAES